ncbi:MAG TPA: PIN domain-containing protein [Thermoanaerobaculia bacterium]|nr:PIN domain-containing protein [Thermoanaerobaculia bacterium]
MIAYIDSSVLMRIVLRQPSPLEEWDDLTTGVSSTLITVECLRTIDQLWHRGELSQDDVTEKRVLVTTFLDRLDIRPLDSGVLALASQPLPTPLATLDSIHLSTALFYRGMHRDDGPIYFATHDYALGRAARAMHFVVMGVTV